MTDSPHIPPRSAFRLLPWLFGSLIAVLMAWQDALRLDGLVIAHSAVWGRDFANLWTGGRLIAAHRLDMLYELKPYGIFQDALFGTIRQHNYSYPPVSLFLAAPLGLLAYPVALAVWLIGTGACFLAAIRRYAGRTPHVALVAAMLTPAATMNVWSGQYGFLVGALFLAASLAADRSPVRGGLFAALLTIKPHMGILLPLIFVWKRQWSTIAWAILFVALSVAASGLVFGWGLWADYLHKVPSIQAGLLDHRSDFFMKMMPTVLASTRILGLPGWLGWTMQGCAAAFALWCCRRVARAGCAPVDLSYVAATATFLILPYAFDYDMTAADFGMAVMLERHWPGLSARERAVLIAGFLSPQLIILTGFFDAPVGPLILVATLATQVRIALRSVTVGKPPAPAAVRGAD